MALSPDTLKTTSFTLTVFVCRAAMGILRNTNYFLSGFSFFCGCVFLLFLSVLSCVTKASCTAFNTTCKLFTGTNFIIFHSQRNDFNMEMREARKCAYQMFLFFPSPNFNHVHSMKLEVGTKKQLFNRKQS